MAGVGTGGTISGVGQYLKSQNPAIQIIGADPEGSVYSGGDGRPYLVEGIGEDFWPETYDRGIVDRVVPVTDRDSFLTARRVTREEGILIGGSGGTAVWAALEIGKELGPDHVVVLIIPDSGRGYLSKVYDDEWMADYGFLSSRRPHRRRHPRPQGARPAGAGARAPRRDRAGRHRHHAGVRGVADAGGAGRTAAADVVGGGRQRGRAGADEPGLLRSRRSSTGPWPR